MTDNLLLLIAAEVIAVLLLFLGALVLLLKRGRTQNQELLKAAQKLKKQLTKSRAESTARQTRIDELEANQTDDFNYLDQLDDLVQQTRMHHLEMGADRDIVLDITPDAPLSRQALALRHAFLMAEKEAAFMPDSDSAWEILISKMSQIIEFYQSQREGGGDSFALEQEITSLKQRLATVQRYEAMIVELQDKWHTAETESGELIDSFKGSTDPIDPAAFGDWITGCFAPIGEYLNALVPDSSVNLQSAEELSRLRALATSQQETIANLKQRLEGDEAELAHVIDELREQLTVQGRFVQEAETCVTLLEGELQQAHDRLEKLQNSVEQMDPKESAELAELVEELTHESKNMLATIALLGEDNRSLEGVLNQGTGVDVHVLQEKLGQVQQELLNLQTQHIELEERYHDLKSRVV